MKRLEQIFTGNVDTATLKVKQLNGETYLVGPVVMAKEIVMNKVLYRAKELKASVPHWNGRPVVVGHPKTEDGGFKTANDPDVLEAQGIGMIFNTSFATKTKKLKSECWLNVNSLKKFENVEKVVANGEMLEVSTSLYLEAEEAVGTFNDRDYEFVGHNYKPDHLAILDGEIGACSVEDGAGFPRANEELTTNELSSSEKMHRLGQAVRKKFSTSGSGAYLADVYDAYLVYEKYDQEDNTYALYKVGYTLGSDEQTVEFSGEPTKVLCQKTYVDIIAQNEVKSTPSKDTVVSTNTKKGENMNKQAKISKWLEDGHINADQSKQLTDMTDDMFGLFESNAAFLKEKAVETKVEKTAKGNAEITKVDTKAVVAANADLSEKDSDFSNWARNQYQEKRDEFIATILGNASNKFDQTELDKMGITQLEKIASISCNTVDMSAAVPGSVSPTASNKKETPKVTPYVNKYHLPKEDQK